jgi:SNF2 family DNA or RNA helicase
MTGVQGDDAVMMMDRFNSGKTKLLIAHSASIGYGVNLQEACSIVVWFTATYNLEHYLQSNGRVDRQGQKNPVRIFRFIAKDTIEEYVFKRLSEKKLDEEGLKDMMLELQQKRGN